MNTQVVSGIGRLTWIHAFEPYASRDDQAEKYSICFLIPKKNKNGVQALQDAIDAAAEKGTEAGMWKKRKPAKIKDFSWPLKDGDEIADNKIEEMEESGEDYDVSHLRGMWVINASSNMKPDVLDSDREPILDEEDLYNGCWGRISLNFFPFEASGNMGVGAGLNNIQKLREGTKLGGGKPSGAKDFADDVDEDEFAYIDEFDDTSDSEEEDFAM